MLAQKIDIVIQEIMSELLERQKEKKTTSEPAELEVINEKIELLKSKSNIMRLVKAAFIEYVTSGEHAAEFACEDEEQNATDARIKRISDEAEIQILKKMVDQRNESIEFAKKTNHPEIVQKDSFEIAVLKEYLPADATPEMLTEAVNNIASGMSELSMKNMSEIINKVKAMYPTVDGKTLSGIVRNRIMQG